MDAIFSHADAAAADAEKSSRQGLAFGATPRLRSTGHREVIEPL
jgi:hypothetical protein